MNPSQRRVFLILFAVFFIILLPFIAIFSLGYGIDFDKRSVQNNLTISLETYPRNATVRVFNQNFQTPTELGVQAGKDVKLELSKDGFLTETFGLSSQEKNNSIAKINDLWLLPKNSDRTYSIRQDKIINILDEKFLLVEKENGKDYYISNYGFAGPETNIQNILNPSQKKISNNRWQVLLENIFWEKEDGLILYQKNSQNWELINLDTLNHKFKNIVVINKKSLVLLDNKTNLWSYDLENKTLGFIEKGLLGLAFTETPDTIWMLDYKRIYRFERNTFNFTKPDFEPNIFLENDKIIQITQKIDPNSWDNFVPKSLFLGLVFKIGSYAIYIPDSNKSSWQIIANNVKNLSTFGSSLFWLSTENQLYSYNLFIKSEKLFKLPDLNPENSQNYVILYYPKWKRVMIYTKTQVISIWMDTEISNEPVKTYTPLSWIVGPTCAGIVKNNYQYCVDDGKLIYYKNDTFPFP